MSAATPERGTQEWEDAVSAVPRPKTPAWDALTYEQTFRLLNPKPGTPEWDARQLESATFWESVEVAEKVKSLEAERLRLDSRYVEQTPMRVELEIRRCADALERIADSVESKPPA